jgi:hypothetical protein
MGIPVNQPPKAFPCQKFVNKDQRCHWSEYCSAISFSDYLFEACSSRNHRKHMFLIHQWEDQKKVRQIFHLVSAARWEGSHMLETSLWTKEKDGALSALIVCWLGESSFNRGSGFAIQSNPISMTLQRNLHNNVSDSKCDNGHNCKPDESCSKDCQRPSTRFTHLMRHNDIKQVRPWGGKHGGNRLP